MAVRGQAAAPWIALAATLYCAALISVTLAETRPTVAAAPIAATPSPLLAPAPAPKPLTLHEKVVAALRSAGHYGAISGLLDSLSGTVIIKPGITLFAPDDTAFNGVNMNSSLLVTNTLDYHVATSVYSYQQLSSLPLNSTLNTAAPNVVILVTSTGSNGVRLDDVAISDPDLYSDGQVSVQGVSSVFDTAKYNKGVVAPDAAPAPPAAGVPSPAPGYITTPTTPKPASPSKSAAAHIVCSISSSVILVTAVSSVVSLL